MLLEKKKQSRTFGQKAAKVLVFWASRGSAVSGQGSGVRGVAKEGAFAWCIQHLFDVMF